MKETLPRAASIDGNTQATISVAMGINEEKLKCLHESTQEERLPVDNGRTDTK